MSEEQQNTSGDAPRSDEFMLLFARHQRHIYCYVRSLVPEPGDLDEIVQQTNTVMWEKYRTFKPGTNFLAWALAVAQYEVLNHRTRQKRANLLFSNEFLEQVAVSAAKNTDLLAAKLEALADCRKMLPLSDKDLLDRRYKPGATSQSVANAVGRPVVSVYKSLSRIRKRLFHCIEWRLAEKELL